MDEEGVQGVCWVHVPGKANDSDAWLEKAVEGLTGQEREEAYAHVDYLKSIDAAVFKMLEPEDVKLSFLIARKKGYGSALLEYTLDILSERGFKTIYLWTDSSCNWQFYPKHGFELVYEEKSERYSTPDEPFAFMVFRKRLGPVSV